MIKLSKREWNIAIVSFVVAGFVLAGIIYFININKNMSSKEKESQKEEIVETTAGSEEAPSTITEDQTKDIIKAMSGS